MPPKNIDLSNYALRYGIKDTILNSHEHDITLDLSKIQIPLPEDLAYLACIFELASETIGSRSIYIKYPNQEVSKFIAGTMGLFERINGVHAYKVKGSDWFVPLTKIDNDNNSFLVENLEKIMEKSGRPVAGLIDALHTPLTETADNIYYHSGIQENTGWGFACGHVIGNNLSIAFADIGIGFRGARERANKLFDLTDHEIIMDAFREGVTTTTDPYRGIGLAEVWKYVTSTAGGVEVKSSTGVANVNKGRQNAYNGSWNLAGSLITLTIPL